MVFEGRFGPSVECPPESFTNISDEEDPVFREINDRARPNILSYGGSCSSLNNLQIDIDLGELIWQYVRGIVFASA